MKPSIIRLRALEKQLYAYLYAMTVIDFDAETVAPEGSADGRAEATEVLSRASFDLLVNDGTAALLKEAAADAETEQERAEVRNLQRQYDEAAAAYRETVLRGLQEVADALQALQTDARELAARSDAANHARVVLDTAAQQQEKGGLSQAALLDAKIRQLQAESDRIPAQAARLADTAALFHALGGRW